MKKLILVMACLFFTLALTAQAAQLAYDLPWWTVDNGGGTSQGGTYSLNAAIGQPDAGAIASGAYNLEGGFLEGGILTQPSISPKIHLPVLLKSQCEGLWEVEDNDSSAQANGPLSSGAANCGYPDDAKDFFYVDLSAAGTLRIELSSHTGGGVQLLLYYKTTEGNYAARAYLSPYKITYTGQAGRYYIYIYTASGYNTSKPYNLLVAYP